MRRIKLHRLFCKRFHSLLSFATMSIKANIPAASATISMGPISLKPDGFYVIAGPCSIESPAQFRETAQFVKEFGACILRGGIFKMRTNPDSFQGVGLEALSWIREIKNELKMPLMSEITDPRQLPAMLEALDAFQVGSRNRALAFHDA